MKRNNKNQPSRAAVCCIGPISGGAGSVISWVLQSLSSEYNVDLISFQIPDFKELDSYYGTQLQSLNINYLSPLKMQKLSFLLSSGRMPSTFKRHLFMKLLKKMDISEYAVVFADFEADFGVHTLQYIYYPLSSAGEESSFELGGFPDSGLRRFYRQCLSHWSGFDLDAVKQNTAMADSEYAAAMYRRIYNCNDVSVIYPPVCVDFKHIAWENKKNDFIAISRMVPGKCMEDSIEILNEVRLRTKQDIRLHIVAGGAYDPGYRKRIINMAAEFPWIDIHENISKEELNELTVKCRYGIHAMHGEHFGIAVAEMLLAGCIPFVFNTGGPVEIVGKTDKLMFGSLDEAVCKVIDVISDSDNQYFILKQLERQKRLFSTQVFCDKIVQIALESEKNN